MNKDQKMFLITIGILVYMVGCMALLVQSLLTGNNIYGFIVLGSLIALGIITFFKLGKE